MTDRDGYEYRQVWAATGDRSEEKALLSEGWEPWTGLFPYHIDTEDGPLFCVVLRKQQVTRVEEPQPPGEELPA